MHLHVYALMVYMMIFSHNNVKHVIRHVQLVILQDVLLVMQIVSSTKHSKHVIVL